MQKWREAHDPVRVTWKDVVPAWVKVAGLDKRDGEVVAVMVPDPPSPHRVLPSPSLE